MNTASLKVREIAEKVQEEVFTPLSQIGSFLRSINQGIAFINKLWRLYLYATYHLYMVW
jgi:hypothetical protein